MTNPSRGLNVPAIAVAPICALLACEETGSNKVTERVAQAVSCLAPAEFAKALRTVRAALADADRKAKSTAAVSATTPQKERSEAAKQPDNATSRVPRVESTKSMSLPVKPSLSVNPPRPSKTHTFESLCKRYGFDASSLCPSLDRVYEHLSKQGWDPKKWIENESSIRCAVFYWVCKVQDRKIRDLPILCEELSVPLRLVQSVIKSMETIRRRLAQLATADDTTPLNPPVPSVSPNSAPLKRKAEPPVPDSHSASPEPSSKRLRTESVPSETDGTVPEYEEPTRSKPQSSHASEDIDGESLNGTMSSSHERQDVDEAEEEPTPRRRNRLFTSSPLKRSSGPKSREPPVVNSSRDDIDRHETLMEVEEPPAIPRYRPTLVDRSFYATQEEDSKMGEEHNWKEWLEEKRKALVIP
ncbi:hypothetical protein FRB90_012154 [Tulasnella sp. 427]|nr:hypothetical protein FRB90_012154 [Tulasnella sp. 427]